MANYVRILQAPSKPASLLLPLDFLNAITFSRRSFSRSSEAMRIGDRDWIRKVQRSVSGTGSCGLHTIQRSQKEEKRRIEHYFFSINSMDRYPPLGSCRPQQPASSQGSRFLALEEDSCSLHPPKSQPSCVVCQRVRTLRMYCVSACPRVHISRWSGASSGLSAGHALGSRSQLHRRVWGFVLCCCGCGAGHHDVCVPCDNQPLCQPLRGQYCERVVF